ncbi:MAG: copper amine oxidase N-terminal domain-containing protein [Candidatus Tyrphobacter sp.]
MKLLGIAALAALASVCFGLAAVAVPSTAYAQRNIGKAVVAQDQAPAPDFGSPPSGAIPILYNDHHVYAKPDTLRSGRVLAALVRGGTVLIPLRSMFEQMGASVSYDPSTQTVTVSKSGAEVKVTVGRPVVVINGESRPLDVPPIMWHGTVLVPVRVISEGMGAYVQWVPDQHLVVVRYIPPTPPPTPAPPPPSVAPPPPPPPPPPPAFRNEAYIAGDYIISPKVYNEFSPGNTGTGSYAIRGAIEFNTGNIPWMVAGDFRSYQYPHGCASATDPQCNVTNIGGIGQSFVRAFTAHNSDADARLALRIAQPRIYIGVGYLWMSNNYGYPTLRGWGFGAEKLPDLDHTFSLYGSAWYYPNVNGTYTATSGLGYPMSYRDLKYQIGATLRIFGHSGIFIDLGWLGESARTVSSNDPSPWTMNGPYAGIGIRF